MRTAPPVRNKAKAKINLRIFFSYECAMAALVRTNAKTILRTDWDLAIVSHCFLNSCLSSVAGTLLMKHFTHASAGSKCDELVIFQERG